MPRLIVSMTSYPGRMSIIHEAVYTLMHQTLKPAKIILWLGQEKFPNKEDGLPKKVLNLRDFGLTIRWTHDVRSFTKLLPAMKEFPNDLIITVDDDVYYPPDLMEQLYQSWKDAPDCIHAHRARRITFDEWNQIAPFAEWKWIYARKDPKFGFYLEGTAGVLYPPGVLHHDVFDEEKFLRLSPWADDTWFWGMAVLQGTRIQIVRRPIGDTEHVPHDWNDSLWAINITENDPQMKRVLDAYPRILERLIQERVESR